MTYQGAATNAFIGAFAGITDIQGCDACAQRAALVGFAFVSLFSRNITTDSERLFRVCALLDAAACAPTQLAAVETLPLTYPYHYLRNARDNHMPLTFWGYSQLFNPPDSASSAISAREGGGTGTGWAYEPAPNELVAQVGSTDLNGCAASSSSRSCLVTCFGRVSLVSRSHVGLRVRCFADCPNRDFGFQRADVVPDFPLHALYHKY